MAEKPMKREDKRVRHTRRVLGEALIALALAGEYETITIQEITDRAGVGYRTFFRHYADKDALLGEVLRETGAELRGMIGSPAAPRVGPGGAFLQFLPAENGRVLFQHVATQSDLYRVLLASPVALKPILAYAREEAAAALGEELGGPLPAAIAVNHLVTTTIELVRWWLENDMPYPPEQMGHYLAMLTTLPGEPPGP
jgi:AcrR family transcriptional regulator